MEIKEKVSTYFIHFYCDEKQCAGLVAPSKLTVHTIPPKYQHFCTKCNKEYLLEYVYPRTIYEVNKNKR